MTIDELHALPELRDRPQRYEPNVAPITVGDLSTLRLVREEWDAALVDRRLPRPHDERCPHCRRRA